MVSFLYDQNILIYTFAGLCGLGFILRVVINLVYKHLVKESDNPGETKNKMLKMLKMKFETCYKLKIGVNNVDTFVDKNVLRYRFCGVLLSTWENLCGQVLFLILLMVPVCTVFGVAYKCGQDRVLLSGSVGILSSAILILVDKSINLPGKKRMIRLNLLDYLENFCKVRLEQEAFHPELIEQYRREYFQALESGKQISAASTVLKEEPKDELNRRRAAREKKEEDRKLQMLKREEEQRKLEQARKEDEKRRMEDRRLAAARRREEEIQRLEEERKALEARREEIKRKADQKQQSSERKQHEKEEKEKLLNSLEEDIKPAHEKIDMGIVLSELDEITKEKELEKLRIAEKEKTEKQGLPEIKSVGQEQVLTEQKQVLTELKSASELIHKEKEEELKSQEQKPVGDQTSRAQERILVATEVKPTIITPKLMSAEHKNANKELQQKIAFSKVKLQGMSPQEEKVIEDVLREFFA